MSETKLLLIAVECTGLGDIISSTPAIKLMATEMYSNPISIATRLPEYYKNFPYIDKVFHIDECSNKCLDDYHIIKTFNIDVIKQYYMVHEKTDIRQFHAICCGFMLLPDQMTCEYYADEYEDIDDLPEKYIVIHPSITWASRTWDIDKWKSLVAKLNEANIPVISIGKTEKDTPYGTKPLFKLDNTLDLTNKLSLSQCWHVLNKAKVVVTMDSGILHLAGTTDVNIIQLGSSIHPYYRAPYRDGSQQYKYHYIKGDCNIFCASSLNYIYNEVPFKSSECGERYETFECHPPVIKVFDKILSII